MRLVVATTAFALAALACSSEGSPGLPPIADAGDAAVTKDAGRDAASACPSDMIRARGFCIDATEVTAGAYAEFLRGVAEKGAPAAHPACGFNAELAPTPGWTPPPGGERRPMVNVDWCDAVAYCTYVGKRLCGKIGGGAVAATEDVADADKSQWFSACSRDGARPYPYGARYADVCNGGTVADGKVADVKSFSACTGGYDGLFDMSGNVWEWEDACDGSDETSACKIRGGDFNETPSLLSCATAISQPRNNASLDRLGFRCCRD